MKLAALLETRIKKTKKIFRVLEFNESQWLKPYIEFNTEKNRTIKNNEKKGKGVVLINE